MIKAAGRAEVFKYYDSRQRIFLGKFLDGILIGDTQITFSTHPTFTIETTSYCNFGVIHGSHFLELFVKFPDMKKWIVDEIIWNPYDSDRDEFVRLAKQHVDYFSRTDEDVLKKLFYKCH